MATSNCPYLRPALHSSELGLIHTLLIATFSVALIASSQGTPPPLVVQTTLQMTVASRKSACPLGSISTSTAATPSCTPCPAGFFHRGIYSQKCDRCPKNTYNAFEGGVTRTVCRPCGPYSISVAGSAKCTPCKPGFVAARPVACVFCRRGTALPIRGTKCRRCARGFIASEPNSERCEACPTGTTSNNARTACVYRGCPNGKEWTGYTCTPCGPNRYRSNMMKACEPCPLRMVASEDGRFCNTCKPGTSISNMYAETYSRYCEECPANLTTNGESKPVCAVSTNASSNLACNPYTFRDADGDCNRCARDEFLKQLPGGGRICETCPSGTWSPGGLAKSCIACGKDQTVLPPYSIQSLGDSRHITRCGCPDGFVMSDAYDRVWNRLDLSKIAVCEKCPAGTYKATGELRCEACAHDEFSEAGASECQNCPDGTYSSPKMGAACVPFPKCPNGFAVWDAADGCVNGATGCPTGSELQFVGSGDFRKTACIKSNGNLACTGETVYNGVDACIKCSRGFYLSSSIVQVSDLNNSSKSVTKWSCDQCRFGTYSDKENSYKCKSCPKGFIGTQDRCLCDVGFYIDQHRLVCRRCIQPFPFFLHYDCSLSTFLYL